MSVSPVLPRIQRVWGFAGLLLLCLLAGAGCAARGRPAAVLTATATATLSPLTLPTFTATPTATPTPTVTPTAVPTSTVTPTPTITPSAQVEGVYANLEVHQGGSYRLRRRGDLVEADLASTSSAVQHAARQQPQALFTLPPEFRPPFPVLRRGAGQPVLVDGSPDPTQPDPRPFRLQLEPDGRVRYLDHPDVADLGYLAYNLNLTWGTTPAANDQAVLLILAEVGKSDHQPRVTFEAGRLTKLTKYDLTGEIPPELGQLSNLQVLSLRGDVNQGLAGPIPPELGQLAKLAHLDLDLQDNQLTALPPEIGQLQNLRILELDHNQLTALPPVLGQLQNLGWLYLHRNQLTTLPPELGQLQNLTTLVLSSNQLTALPPELGQLQSLELLNLYDNQMTAVPPELGRLQNLTRLELRENPLTGCLPAGWRDLGIRIQFSEPLPFCTD